MGPETDAYPVLGGGDDGEHRLCSLADPQQPYPADSTSKVIARFCP